MFLLDFSRKFQLALVKDSISNFRCLVHSKLTNNYSCRFFIKGPDRLVYLTDIHNSTISFLVQNMLPIYGSLLLFPFSTDHHLFVPRWISATLSRLLLVKNHGSAAPIVFILKCELSVA